MNRFLRKYSKILLAVFGTGLMIVFLMPQIPDLLSQFGASSSLVATFGEDGRSVSANEWNEVRNELQFLDRFQTQLPPLPLVGQLDSPAQYYLLVHEASQAGMIGGFVTTGLTDDNLLELSRQTGFPPAVIRQALTNRSGIARYLRAVINAGHHSDRRLKAEGRRLFDAADTQVVALKAKAPEAATEPSQAEIQEQFDTYRDVEPGEGKHGFGYRLPHRVALEWITVSADDIDTMIRNSDAMSERELMKFWRRNDARFPGFESADDIPLTVRDAMLDEIRQGYVDSVTRSINDKLRLPRRGFEESGGFLVLPDSWQENQVSLDEIRDSVNESFGLQLKAVATSGEVLITLEDLRTLEGIGLARSDKFSRFPVGLFDLVTAGKEFEGSGIYPIQQGVAGPFLKDARNNLYIFRITGADAARPPHDLLEIRGEVVDDLRRLAHYQQMLAQIDDIERTAETDGIETLAANWNATQPTGKVFQRYNPGLMAFYIQQGQTPPPSPATLPGLANQDADVVDAILAKTTALDPGTQVAEMDEATRVMVLPSEENLAIVAVRLVDRRPLDRDAYQRMAAQRIIPMLLINEELGGDVSALQDAFTLESLQARHDFRLAGDEDDDSQPENDNATNLADAGGS